MDIALAQGLRQNPLAMRNTADPSRGPPLNPLAAQDADDGRERDAGRPATGRESAPPSAFAARKPQGEAAAARHEGAALPSPAGASQEAANLLALQARQHHSSPALSLCAHADRGVLRLFV